MSVYVHTIIIQAIQ